MAEPDPRPKSSARQKPGAVIPVVGIGASAGGLKADIALLEAVPEHAGMAFVLIQHLLPDHESFMAKLLGARTHMVVRQIDHEMIIERDCVYVNAPGQNVSLSGNRLLISDQPADRLANLPFDLFLTTLALERNDRAMCVILSGTGKDGSKGLKSVKRVGGFVIAQDPEDAEADGMPNSAIQTGDVDAVLIAAKIPEALMNWNGLTIDPHPASRASSEDMVPAWLDKIIRILREQTGSDFSLYKAGTLVRRITRRMALFSSINTQGTNYVKLLQSSPQECEALAADLLINVTQFFRDPKAFQLLERNVLPGLVSNHKADRPLRVWVAGCSSGEEVWSLAMLLDEAIEADGRNLRLQILASDLDPDALATARAGIYPNSIAGDLSAARLARYFTPVEDGFKVCDALRKSAVFTRQNLISDPPFARLDLISCRNVMIYLGLEAQARIMSHFHFSLVTDGILLLGTSETGGDINGRFEIVSKAARVYRRLGKKPSAEPAPEYESRDEKHKPLEFLLDLDPNPETRFGEIARSAVARYFTPASVLVTRKGVCLHFLGSVDQYLEISEGSASFEILPLVPLSHRSALRSAIAETGIENPLIRLTGLQPLGGGGSKPFVTEVRFIPDEPDDLVLVTFRPAKDPEASSDTILATPAPLDAAEVKEISGLRLEIEHTNRLLERALEIERRTRRESLRLNEEYQSTNEELVTSKEELQALNEELMVLNSQLQETLEIQRTTANDLTNVLYSTNVATIFLDSKLCIRFFTPATKAVFGVIATDVGRPLKDLQSLALEKHLMTDAGIVLESREPIEREIETADGGWFLRRILPYRTIANEVEGVVITYVDVLEQHRATEALRSAIRQSEHAVIVKTRFLASASHDLRQPLQTLTFVSSLLARDATNENAKHLIRQIEQAVAAMSGMLSTMLDINQIEAGVITFQLEDVPIAEILSNLYSEFLYHAHAKSIELKMAHCSSTIRTDRRLLEQMLRNLLSNAIRYTDSGGVLIGCRHRNGRLRIEIWDTGIGIPGSDLVDVFNEYHQVSKLSQIASEGFGLGLSIVQRLADLLGHQIDVSSRPGRGSVFSIEVDIAEPADRPAPLTSSAPIRRAPATTPKIAKKILIVEDEADLRELLGRMLTQSGYDVSSAASLKQAVELASQASSHLDLLIADYNLPDGRTGIELARVHRLQARQSLPVIILTGDISATTEALISSEGITQLNKPISRDDLETTIQTVIRESERVSPTATLAMRETKGDTQVIIVDDDPSFCESLTMLLEADGLGPRTYASAEAFLADLQELSSKNLPVCVLIDAYLGGLTGFDVLEAMQRVESVMTAIMITGHSDVSMSVKAMKSGALDFIEKPIDSATLLKSIREALAVGQDAAAVKARKIGAAKQLANLTVREREVLDRILSGHPNKNIAADLGISQRTVESHRASVMAKSGCKTLPELVRLAVRAS